MPPCSLISLWGLLNYRVAQKKEAVVLCQQFTFLSHPVYVIIFTLYFGGGGVSTPGMHSAMALDDEIVRQGRAQKWSWICVRAGGRLLIGVGAASGRRVMMVRLPVLLLLLLPLSCHCAVINRCYALTRRVCVMSSRAVPGSRVVCPLYLCARTLSRRLRWITAAQHALALMAFTVNCSKHHMVGPLSLPNPSCWQIKAQIKIK